MDEDTGKRNLIKTVRGGKVKKERMIYDEEVVRKTFLDEITHNIEYLEKKIQPVVRNIVEKNRMIEPRIYFVSPEDLGLILLEIASPKFQIETFYKLFPEIDKFILKDNNSISGFTIHDGTSFKLLKEEHMVNNNPLKHMKHLTSTVESQMKNVLVYQSNLIIKFFSEYPYEYERFWNNKSMIELDADMICSTIKAIFFHNLSFLLIGNTAKFDESLNNARQGSNLNSPLDWIKKYQNKINSSLRKLNYFTFRDGTSQMGGSSSGINNAKQSNLRSR